MKAVDRFLLLLYLVLLTLGFAALIVIPSGYISYDLAKNILGAVYGTWYYIVIIAVLILINIKFIFSLLSGDKPRQFGIAKTTVDGEMVISNDTLKALVLRACDHVKGIRDIKVMIRPENEKINILIKLLIMPDMNIPQTAKMVQDSVKGYIESIAEIPVGQVKVDVSGIASSTKLRVE